jgi:NADPH:quinone reductase-like Zn-dependent oxidoreductase
MHQPALTTSGPDTTVCVVRAVIWDRYGPPEVLRVKDVPQPVPKPDEVLIQVHATTVNRTDSEEELVRSLGAEHVIDFTQEDFTKNGQAYDAVFDAVGKVSFPRCKGSLKPGGKYLATDHLSNLALVLWTRFSDRRVVFPIPPRYTKQDVLFLKQLMETGKYRAVIDRCYPLDQVLEATFYVATGQKIGNVVLTVIG